MSREFLECQSYLYSGMAIQAVIVSLFWQTGIISPWQQLVAAAVFAGAAVFSYPKGAKHAPKN